jgi:CIC family chloride channel protein
VSDLPGEFVRTGRHGFPVVHTDGTLFGIVSLEDYRRATGAHPDAAQALLVRDIATRDLVTVFPDESVSTALRRMAPRDLSRLPVVARDHPRQLVGIVRRNDIVRAYEVGALRREAARQQAERTLRASETRTQFVDIPLPAGAAGKTIASLALPRAAVLISIRRGRELLIPRGDTTLQAGDLVTALCERDCADALRAALTIVEQKKN